MTLKVTKISRVNPATGANDSVNSLVLPLTFFDLRWLKFHPTERLIFYKLDTREFSFHSLILPRLELSLSVVLRHYLPLAGRLTWGPQDPKPRIVVSPDDSVSLTLAESDADFSIVSGKGQRPEREVRSLVPELRGSRDSQPLLSLQVTLFPNQGYSIGVTSHHSAMDGRTIVMFIKSWAHICKHGTSTTTLPNHLTPSLDRTVINVPQSLEAKIFDLLLHFSADDKDSLRSLEPPPVVEIGPEVVRVTLDLSSEEIETLRERARKDSARSLHLSTFVVANAYLWTCLVKARGGDADRPTRFMYAADFRNKLDPPVPETYLGNCVFSIGCFGYEAGVFLGEDGFLNAVEIISDSVRGFHSQNIEKLCELYVDGTKKVKPGTHTGSIAGSNRFGLYATDFGWGKPINADMVSIDRNEGFSMSERKDEAGGVEIGLCLNKAEMDVFVSLFRNGLGY